MKNLKPYPNYKKSNVEWLGDVPEHWEVTRVKNIFRLVAEPAPKNNDYELLSVYTEIGVKPRRELAEKGNKASTTDGYWLVKKGDIVVNKLLAWMGAIGVSKYEGVTSPAYDILRAKAQISEDFFHYMFRMPTCVSELKKHSKGIMEMRLRLYFDKFGDIKIPFPNLAEQTAIANYLDQKTAQIDQAIAQKERLITLLKERQQIVIHQAVTQGLDSLVELKDSGVEWIGKVPKHWEVKKLKYVCNLISEKIFSKESSLNYIGMENIISWTGEYIPTNSETEGLANYFQKGDILFGKLRPYLAKVFFSENEGICSTEFLVYRTQKSSFNFFIHKLMLSYNFIDIVNASTYGSKMPRANSEFIGNLLIALPPKEEQEQIINYINDQTAKIQKSITQQTALIEQLKEYKTVLIDAAVTGKVRIN